MCVEFGFNVWIFLTTYTKLTRLISENYIAPVVELINAIFAFILQKNILQLQAFFRVLEPITLIWCGLMSTSVNCLLSSFNSTLASAYLQICREN